MPSHSESRIVPYTADLMYQVVADVERYPEFLPWCAGLRVLKRERDGAREVLIAEMLVGYKSLRERYTSRVVLDKDARTIDVVQTEGVFRALENHWRFAPEGMSARVDFSILFEFKSRVLALAANAVLGPVMLRMSHAFEARAKTLSEQALQQK
ncbi:MAG TPA: type II toxin-antitoxin system RatA family toxin [Rhizomicrobium sp.]|nr:type II toxin-antitoxin system RatA family toxin [Rhizomicrobium sp.]